METCSRCWGNHGDLHCIYYKIKNYCKSNIDLQTSKLQS